MYLMNQEIKAYNQAQSDKSKEICELLATRITKSLPKATDKIWHAHPVWFLDGNPTVGFVQQKSGIRLMFWSGADFDEPKLMPSASGKFKDASVFYNSVDEVNLSDLTRWLKKSEKIQWDYKNIVKHRGILKRIS